MDTQNEAVNSQAAAAGAGRDAPRPDGAGGSKPSNTDPQKSIPLKLKVLGEGVDSGTLSARGKRDWDKYERAVLESCDTVRGRVSQSAGYLPWLKDGDRVRLKRTTSAVGPKVGGCGTVAVEHRGEGLRLIVIDWDEDAWPPGIRGRRDEIFPGRRMFPFSLKLSPDEYLELLDANGDTCQTPS